jgi:hypothetical protein
LLVSNICTVYRQAAPDLEGFVESRDLVRRNCDDEPNMDARDLRLLRDCAAVARLTAERPTARERLEREVGPELARRLADVLRPKPPRA